MNIYSLRNGVLTYLPPAGFKLEKQLQQLIENNLSSISTLELVKSEFIIQNKRIDTLAFNRHLKAFVIIEYKRDRNYSVIDQGISYLKLLSENKAECLIKLNEKYHSDAPLSKRDLRWGNCYIIFAAPDFTANQINAACYRNLKIVLWRVALRGDSIITISQISYHRPQVTEQFEPDNQTQPEVSNQNWPTTPLWQKIKLLGNRT